MSATLAPNPFETPLPPAVRRQTERATELHRQSVEDPAAAAARETARAVAAERAANEAANPPLPGFEPPATPVVQPEPPPADTWEQRYRSLEGKYNAEVPTLNANVRSLQQQLANMQTVVTTMEVNRANTPPPPPAPVQTQPVAVDPKDAEVYGEDLVAAARRWARDEVAGEFSTLRQQIASLQGTTNEALQETRQESVKSHLDVHFPNWQTVNQSNDFILWLKNTDPFSGVERHRQMIDAYRAGDGNRVLNFFQAFDREHTAITPAPGIQPTQTAPAAGRVPLENLAAPGRSRTPAGNGAPNEPQYFTNQEIAAFYRDVNAGKFNGRDADKARIEKDIVDAAANGRIR